MTGDLYLGRIFGIPFRLHWSWFLALFLISWTLAVGFFPQTLPEYRGDELMFWLLGLVAALGLFVSILLHELGHAFVARRYGIPVRGIRLFVFGGVAELGAEPRKPSHEILIALGGPAVTLALIFVYSLLLSAVLGGSAGDWDVQAGMLSLQGRSLPVAGTAAVLYYLGMINTIVLIFNLIPAFPLDGGRVFRGIVWAVSGDFLTGTRVAAAVGIGFAWLLFIGGFLTAFRGNLLGGVWMFFLGTFLQNAAQSSVAYAQFQHLLRGVHVADMMQRRPVTLDADLTLRDAAENFFLRYPYKAYPVVSGGRFVGVLTLRDVQSTPRDQWDTLRVGDVAARDSDLPVIRPQEPALHALRKLAATGKRRLPVVDNGVLVGLLCGRDLMDLMEIRAGLAMPRDHAGSE